MSIDKPSSNEEEYFKKLDLERKKQWEKERASKMNAAEKQKLKDLHFMKCPKCGMDLHSFELEGITLDRCVSCHGTFFDDGELEALLGKKEGHSMFGRVLGFFK